jgi:hypothetical protein
VSPTEASKHATPTSNFIVRFVLARANIHDLKEGQGLIEAANEVINGGRLRGDAIASAHLPEPLHIEVDLGHYLGRIDAWESLGDVGFEGGPQLLGRIAPALFAELQEVVPENYAFSVQKYDHEGLSVLRRHATLISSVHCLLHDRRSP